MKSAIVVVEALLEQLSQPIETFTRDQRRRLRCRTRSEKRVIKLSHSLGTRRDDETDDIA
jgi:hypothetical protein